LLVLFTAIGKGEDEVEKLVGVRLDDGSGRIDLRKGRQDQLTRIGIVELEKAGTVEEEKLIGVSLFRFPAQLVSENGNDFRFSRRELLPQLVKPPVLGAVALLVRHGMNVPKLIDELDWRRGARRGEKKSRNPCE